MSKKERIYIVAKTYPHISEKYAELVCTAGVRENGSWIRLYPIPFRLLKDEQKFSKYTWIEAEVTQRPRNKDFRLESFTPTRSSITVESKPKRTDWEERRRIIFNNKILYTNKQKLVDAAKNKENPISLALFKPSKIIDFVIEEDDKEWDKKKLVTLYNQSKQLDLFHSEEEMQRQFRIVPKVPYKFSYRFTDDEGKESKLMITDWEIGMLYFNCLKGANGNEQEAVNKVRKKYFNEFLDRDIHFILGTTKANHRRAPNPFIIIGVFYPPYPPKYKQPSLFEFEV